ncbi:MAG: transposase, partial [Mariprofundaceae bacterium]|nr:transposase [Mariprofundaceae bacterium]
KNDFKDARSIVGKRFQETVSKTKPELLVSMVKRAMTHGIEADYLLADAWFGNKSTIRLAHDVNSVPVLRMKNNKTTYRYYSNNEGNRAYKDYTAAELHHLLVRKNWKVCSETPYQCVAIEVELNLAQKKGEPENWVKTQLLYVRGATDKDEKTQVGKKDWALFLTTDLSLVPSKLLEIYALRWGIEVYFKEAKQYLGWLKEQTETFASPIASLHLCAIRYTLLVYAKIQNNCRVCDVRKKVDEQLTLLSYGKKMWGLFRFIIQTSLSEIEDELMGKKDLIMATIDKNILQFFTQALQLDHRTLALETCNHEDL